MVKKATTILFLSLYLTYTTGCPELFKINALVAHFYETQKSESAISFSKFLVMHYITDDLNNKDNDGDSQLPFKSAQTGISNSVVLYISNANQPQLATQSVYIRKSGKLIAKYPFSDSDFICMIWHPPKYG
jgi:hypothetical protein